MRQETLLAKVNLPTPVFGKRSGKVSMHVRMINDVHRRLMVMFADAGGLIAFAPSSGARFSPVLIIRPDAVLEIDGETDRYRLWMGGRNADIFSTSNCERVIDAVLGYVGRTGSGIVSADVLARAFSSRRWNDFERRVAIEALRLFNDDRAKIAADLGLSVRQLEARLSFYPVPRSGVREASRS